MPFFLIVAVYSLGYVIAKIKRDRIPTLTHIQLQLVLKILAFLQQKVIFFAQCATFPDNKRDGASFVRLEHEHYPIVLLTVAYSRS